jgi:hypothetical protein
MLGAGNSGVNHQIGDKRAAARGCYTNLDVV